MTASGPGNTRLVWPSSKRTRYGVGLGGVALLMGPGASGAGAWPVLEVLGTAVCYAIGPVIADRKLAGADSLAVTAACLGLAAIVYAPAAALTWPHQMPPARVLSALAVLAVVCTALAFILYFRLISEVGAVRATVITYVNPAVAVALGAAVLGEPFTPVIAMSFTLILAGSMLATRSAAHRGAGVPRRGSAEIARAGSKNLTEDRAAGGRPAGIQIEPDAHGPPYSRWFGVCHAARR